MSCRFYLLTYGIRLGVLSTCFQFLFCIRSVDLQICSWIGHWCTSGYCWERLDHFPLSPGISKICSLILKPGWGWTFIWATGADIATIVSPRLIYKLHADLREPGRIITYIWHAYDARFKIFKILPHLQNVVPFSKLWQWGDILKMGKCVRKCMSFPAQFVYQKSARVK